MHTFHLRDEELVALPERALWWSREKILVIADLHLGRAETHGAWGLARSAAIEFEDLVRLDQLVGRLGPHQILVLGDFIHHARALGEDVRARFLNFRSRWPCAVSVVVGNHDRAFLETHAEQFQVRRIPHSMIHEPFCFSHDHVTTPLFNWQGHLHPAWRWDCGADQLKIPCFWIQENCGILPAFSSWAAGSPITAQKRDQIFLTIENEKVIPLGRPSERPPELG